MNENIVEYLRQKAILDIFEMESFKSAWPIWSKEIKRNLANLTPTNLIDLGDRLADIFELTKVAGRSQSTVSAGGNAWEGLVCWYLNLNLIGSRTVVIKQKKALIPEPIRQSLIVSYGTFPSGTESDLIAITFPDTPNYSMNKWDISVRGNDGDIIPTKVGRNDNFNYKALIDELLSSDFNECEVGVIQCKTNWNDNAQIPMLWDMIYASSGFMRQSISVGTSIYSINNLKRFTYSFVTVPTVNKDKFKINSTSVQRVRNLSGGNYWGYPSESSIAHSIKDIFGRVFSSASTEGLAVRLNRELTLLNTTYSYFKLF